ncbi:MAG: DUF5667 domain-containing protein [Patescibacteria group bacterium]|nr:DUF5667 domain-containing protein [Patescibacteria group bacterium]
MSQELKRQLKSLKTGEVSPRAEWLKSSREVLLSQIKNTVPAEKAGALDNVWFGLSVFMPQKFVFSVVRPMAVLFIVALVGTSGWIATVDASYEALPGDWLYPAKRAMEKTQVTAATIFGAKNTETKLHSEFAKRRATEIKKVVAGNDPQKDTKVSQTVSDLKVEITSVAANLQEIKNIKEGGTGDVAKEVQKNTEQINTVLKEVKDDLSVGTSTESKAISKEISEAKDMAKDATVQAVGVLVTKHLEGDVSVTKEQVAEAIDKTMQNVVTEVGVTKQNVEGMNTVVSAVSAEVKDKTATTSVESDKLIDAAEKTKEATVQTQAAAVAIDKQVSEVKSLVESGDLEKAMDKVKEATETTKQVEKIQDSTLTTAQGVLPTPVVAVVKEQVTTAIQTVSSTAGIKVIVSTTAQVIEPGKLPVLVIVTTSPTIVVNPSTSASSTKR